MAVAKEWPAVVFGGEQTRDIKSSDTLQTKTTTQTKHFSRRCHGIEEGVSRG
jgi:hypothetical protein